MTLSFAQVTVGLGWPLVIQKSETFDPGIAIVSSGFAMINGPTSSVKEVKINEGLVVLVFKLR
jgi:hypothetical protein